MRSLAPSTPLVLLVLVGCTYAGARSLASATASPAHEEVVSAAEESAPETVREVREPEPAPAEPEPLLDAWSLAAREDGAACREALKAEGFGFKAYPDREAPDPKTGCGIPHAVVVVRGPTGVRYTPPVTVDCALARALAGVERIVQEEAETHLHGKVVRIGNLGGFACRPRNSRKGAGLSAHAFGSAIDVSSFHLASGNAAIVARDYGETPRSSAARDARRQFLRAVFARLRHHEADLTYTVGPDFNRAHHDHFHLDRGGWKFWFER